LRKNRRIRFVERRLTAVVQQLVRMKEIVGVGEWSQKVNWV
jgi:hypothetical protein